MAQLLKNNAYGVLDSSGITDSATSMTLTDASRFDAPTGGDYYLATLIGFGSNGAEDEWEIVRVTAKASNTLTIVRAQEGTTAVAWPGATQVQLRLTAGTMATKADLASPTFTGTVGGITKSMVGLGSVDNTSDAGKPVSTAQQTALDLKANLASPALTGTPTAPTATAGTSTTQVATTAFVNAEIAADAAPLSHVGAGGTAHANVVAAGAAGFMTGSDKTKLDGIATGANNYTHPANHSPSIITQDSSNRFVTDAEKTAWNAKQAALVSGTSIKTINGTTLLGSGDLAINGGATISDSAPGSPVDGQLWVDGTTGIEYKWFNDGTSSQWVATDLAGYSAINDAATSSTGLWSSSKTSGELATKLSATNPAVTGTITEDVFAITDGGSVDIDPANGSIQTWTLGASRSPTATSFAAGQSIILMVTAGANAITWPSVTWSKVGGSGAAPSLTATGATCVILWKVGSTLYGSLLGTV